jgi:hypothetical protein
MYITETGRRPPGKAHASSGLVLVLEKVRIREWSVRVAPTLFAKATIV